MRLSPAAAAILVVFAACDGVNAPTGLRPTPAGPGVAISWELTGLGLPRMPFPNDALTRPDPTASTGLRLSLPRDTSTFLEDDLRRGLNELDGFGGAGPIFLPFDGPIDLHDLRRRQWGTATLSASAFAAHAIYLVDLESGLPSPLGLGAPFSPDALPRPDGYHPTDPRAGQPSLVLETVAEGADDTDFDGTRDEPTTLDGAGGEGAELVDRLTGEWDRESRTLILRPLLPLRAGARYAVVVTERLRGAAGERIRSPLPFVHPPAQMATLRPLSEHFAANPDLYGDLAARGFDGVAFAWAFTVQSTPLELAALARGLEGTGPFSALGEAFLPVMAPLALSGGLAGRPCPDPGAALYRASGDVFQSALEASAAQLGLGVSERDALVASYDTLSEVVGFTFEAPYLIGSPTGPSPDDRFPPLDARGGTDVRRNTLTAIAMIPTERGALRQPFRPLLLLHDAQGSKVDSLSLAGLVLRHGLAPVFIDAPEHGLGLDEESRTALLNVFGNQCLAPFAEVLVTGRASDWDGDGRLDPGAFAHGPDPLHARDLRRQSALDHVALARLLSTFDGRLASATSVPRPGDLEPATFDGDFDRDGAPDPLGDWDGDGTPDLGGEVAVLGVGMGANVASLAHAASPRITTASLIAAGGGLAQAFMRSGSDEVRAGTVLSAMGPIVWTRRSAGPDISTGCLDGDLSVRVTVSDLAAAADTEVACISEDDVRLDGVAIVRNLTKRTRGCAGIDDDGGSFIPIAADAGDRWSLELYDSGAGLDFGTCEFADDAPFPIRVLDAFSVESGAPSFGRCPECATFRRTEYQIGAPLVFPAGGLGRRRQSPGLRTHEALLATALYGADPLAYASADRTLIAATIGDPVMPIAAAVRLARANAALPFLPPDAPRHLMRWAAPSSPSPHDALVALHVVEGASWLERAPVPFGSRFLADPDDLSEGRARFAPNGSDSASGSRPITPTIPVRAANFTLVYIDPHGAHGPDLTRLFSPTTVFDASQYLINHAARFAATSGAEIRHRDAPSDHLCLADSSCAFLLE